MKYKNISFFITVLLCCGNLFSSDSCSELKGYWVMVNSFRVYHISENAEVRMLNLVDLEGEGVGKVYWKKESNSEFEIRFPNELFDESCRYDGNYISMKNRNPVSLNFLPWIVFEKVDEEVAIKRAMFDLKEYSSIGVVPFDAENGLEALLDKIAGKQDLEEVYDAYVVLMERNDGSAIEYALEDLESEDDYLWLNAALYLGHFRDNRSIPYLIKALRHTASREYENIVLMLEVMTDKKFGDDFGRWKDWWESSNPNYINIDWKTFLGHSPRNGPKVPTNN